MKPSKADLIPALIVIVIIVIAFIAAGVIMEHAIDSPIMFAP